MAIGRRTARGTPVPLSPEEITQEDELTEARRELIDEHPLGWFEGTLRLINSRRDDWGET